MKRLTAILLILSGAFCAAWGQGPGSEIAKTATPLDEVELVALPVMDNQALLEAELARRTPGRAPRFAEVFEVDIRPETHGHWEVLPGGTAVWRLRIQSMGAHSLNFGFREYYLPPGGKLLIYDPQALQLMGPFTPSDNEAHDQLWTPVLEGEEAVLEVQIPLEQRPYLRLRLTSINHDFLGFAQLLSGTCNLDAICGASNGWGIVDWYREAIRSTAVYGLGGNTFCTGYLVNNTREDCTPYFITAFHCEVTAANAPSLVAYWNYQNSYCRQIGSIANGSAGNGQLNLFNTGAIWRAAHPGTDFTLLELDDPIPSAAQPLFAGWSREATPPQDTVACIHHPDGAEKRITFSFQGTYAGAWGSGSTPVPTGNHLIVPDWDIGATASGSSGGPLFNRQLRVVGQLHGGAANCNNNQYDAFGWFRHAWTGGGTPSTRLRNWLAPGGDEPLVLDGRRLSACNATVLVASPTEVSCLPGTVDFIVEAGEAFSGPVSFSTAGLPPGATASFTPNPALPGSTLALSVSFSGANLPSGTVSFTIIGQHGNEVASAAAAFSAVNQAPGATLILSPGNGAAGLPLAPVFQWASVPQATSYDFQLAEDSTFANIFFNLNLTGTTRSGLVLAPLTTYYSRVRARNACGPGPWSVASKLTTSALECHAQAASDCPKIISPQGEPTVHSEILITEPGTLASISLSQIDISHSYVGDLSAFLRSPSGKVVHLFHRPGFPVVPFGCWGSNLLLGFDDAASNTQANLEGTCHIVPPAIQGTFQPLGPLSSLIGEPVAGIWRLTIIDHQHQDGGQLNGWQINFCRTYPQLPQLFQLEGVVEACLEQPVSMDVYVGAGFGQAVALQLSGLPAGTAAAYSSNPALPGEMVTITLDGFVQAGTHPVALTASDGNYSYTANFQLNITALPEAPLLLIPDNYSPVFQNQLFFSWSPVPGADTFLLEIARDPWFEEMVEAIYLSEHYSDRSEDLPGGPYYWRVTALNRCGAQASEVFSFFMEGEVTSSGELPGQADILVFPNPAREAFYIQWPAPSAVEYQVRLFTLGGQLVRRAAFRGPGRLEVGQLPAGLYILAASDGQQILYRRLVIQ